MTRFSRTGQLWGWWVGVLLVLMLVYSSTLLTQVSGGGSPYNDDVGETQVALNIWGTIHYTGYPLFLILGNLARMALRGLGAAPATAPSLYALGWGLIALSIFYALLVRLTGRPWLAGLATLLLGLTRTIWAHNVIPEVYSMSLALQLALLALALWPSKRVAIQHRVWLLALVGGIGVAHHRMIALLAPGLILSVLPDLWRLPRRHLIGVLSVATLLSLVGFIPYLYLPLRKLDGSPWVYGDPSTWAGFLDQFTGREANWLWTTSGDQHTYWQDFLGTLNILGTELTPVLAVLTALGCLAALLRSATHRPMLMMLACLAGPFTFLIVQHRVVMPQAVAMPLVMALLFGLTLAVNTLFTFNKGRRWLPHMIIMAALVGAVVLWQAHRAWVYALTHSPDGVQMVAVASHTPRENGKAALFIPWGPAYTAVAFSKYVTGENADLRLLDHKADLATLATQGVRLYTPKDTFYRYPVSWWEERLGRVYLSAAADGLVAVRREPATMQPPAQAIPVHDGVFIYNTSLCTTATDIQLTIVWGVQQPPSTAMSVFVHLTTSASPSPLTQADSIAPVYGWYPTSRWSAGEVVYDHYALARDPAGQAVVFGMYTHDGSQFTNYGVTTLSLANAPACP